MIVYRRRITVDMTPEGEFRRSLRVPLAARVAIGAVLIAMFAFALAVGAFFVGLALTLLPIAVLAVAVAYVAFRIQAWRSRRAARYRRDVFQP